MMQVLVIEDEAVAARRLIKLISNHDLEVIGHLKSNEELEQYISKNKEPDLYFMDIHLNDGIIFDFLQNHTLEAPIIFTTAYDQYAIKAFKQNSIDYLLKPIDEEELSIAIQKFKKQKSSTQAIDITNLSKLLLSQKAAKNYRDRIKIKIGDRLKSIPVKDITHIYSEDKINYIHTKENRSYPIDHALDQIAADLDPKFFHKVSRSHIVAIDAIKDVISYSNSRLKIELNIQSHHEIIVARERVKVFKDWLG